ncbi:histone deacetylase family protein [Desulfosoma caldarium]|uniref:Acetoin utilization deacetylase AcuC-like enzyme n=1 Tax=Desulfosoma caldarium TaxID=610254 RepID=A0A3N1UQK0_9BACT|nr:histone deacetylase family protein [Desulfosoma caldarium]ROQ90817.1 acetoin utilization deacetylase AcuC-like enzyme [Desulfosoma caldarium]
MLTVVFHKAYLTPYSTGAVETPARVRSIMGKLQGCYEVVAPRAASKDDLLRAHTPDHLTQVQLEGKAVWETAVLAAGGAICAARLTAQTQQPVFAAVRPPGHHAGRNRYGGFCFFNNMAVSLLALLHDGTVKRAAVIDFDMHRGDGTAEIFQEDARCLFLDVSSAEKEHFVETIAYFLDALPSVDIIGVSAGFDMHLKDWGGCLCNRDYHYIGRLVGETARRKASGRVFAVLEGGYLPHELGKAVYAFCRGLEGKELSDVIPSARP